MVVISQLMPNMPNFFSRDAFSALHNNRTVVLMLVTQLLSRSVGEGAVAFSVERATRILFF